MKTVTVNAPGSDDGGLIEVLYLGLFESGKTHEVDDEAVERWEALTGREWPTNGNFDPFNDFLPVEEVIEEPADVVTPQPLPPVIPVEVPIDEGDDL